MMEEHWKNRTLVVLDVETTGLDASEDRVIEVGIVRFERGEIVERYGQLIDPERDVPEEVVKLTGIQPQQLEGQPTFSAAAPEILRRLEGAIVVAYNLSFDKGFIAAELGRTGRQWPTVAEIDPLVFVRQLHKGQGSKKLGAAAARMGLELKDAHRAVNDAEITGHLLFRLAEQLPHSLDDLLVLQTQWETLHAQERALWRRNRAGGDTSSILSAPSSQEVDADGLVALGPAYVYGEDTDPLRALFAALPDAGSRR
jgi:DNA polymerase III epsilon subunit family exonuclease